MSEKQKTLCPRCSSEQVTPMRKQYSTGLGCLGALFFGWIGLLIGFLGGNDVEMYCMNCGHRWQPGGRGFLSGCGCLIILVLLIFLIRFVCIL